LISSGSLFLASATLTCMILMIAIYDSYVKVIRNRTRLYSPTSQSIASSRVLNVGNSRCEKLLKFS